MKFGCKKLKSHFFNVRIEVLRAGMMWGSI
jgi:hypothetical protein